MSLHYNQTVAENSGLCVHQLCNVQNVEYFFVRLAAFYYTRFTKFGSLSDVLCHANLVEEDFIYKTVKALNFLN